MKEMRIISFSVVKNLIWVCLFFVIVIVTLTDQITVAGDRTERRELCEASICETNLTKILPHPYNKISLVCKPVWNNYVIRYSIAEDNVLTIIVSTLYTTGWVGIGFSKDGLMVGSNAMVGWIDKRSVPRIKQYHIQGKTAENVIPNKGRLKLTNVPETAVFHEGFMYLAFQIKLEKPRTKQNIILAYGAKYPTVNYRLTSHDDQSSLKIDFISDSNIENEEQSSSSDKIKMHGFLGIVGWGVLLPTGTIIARYFRHKDPLWFYLHIVIQLVGYLLLLANFFTGRRSFYVYGSRDGAVIPHKILGTFAVSLANLQMLALFIRPGKESRWRKYWNWCHHWTGRTGLFCGMVNIMIGIQIGDQKAEWKIVYGFVLCFTLVAVSIFELFAYFARREVEARAKAIRSPTPL